MINIAIPISINGNRIKRLREQKGWSLKQLAAAVKLSESEICRAEESGRGLNAVAIQRLKIWADEVEKFQNDPIQIARREVAAMKEKVLKELRESAAQTEVKNTFGEKIRQLREKRGLSRNKMGTILGINPTTIKKWETGIGYPLPKNLKKLAAFFDIKISALNKENKKTHTVSTDLTENNYEKFNAICESLSITQSEMLRRMITNFDFQRYYRESR